MCSQLRGRRAWARYCLLARSPMLACNASWDGNHDEGNNENAAKTFNNNCESRATKDLWSCDTPSGLKSTGLAEF